LQFGASHFQNEMHVDCGSRPIPVGAGLRDPPTFSSNLHRSECVTSSLLMKIETKDSAMLLSLDKTASNKEEEDSTDTTYFHDDYSESTYEEEIIQETCDDTCNIEEKIADGNFSSLSCSSSLSDEESISVCSIYEDENQQQAHLCYETDDDDDCSFVSFADNDEDCEQSVNSSSSSSICFSVDSNEDASSCSCSSCSDKDEASLDCSDDDEANTLPYTNTNSIDKMDLNNLVQPKSLPAPTNTYKVVCLSFLEPNIATSVSSKVFDESLRMLKKGGLLYVVDKGGCTVKKNPKMRQMLMRVMDPTVKHKVHDIETREILQTNGFSTTVDDNNNSSEEVEDELVRWMGIKP
jgi:hypothetical protein